MDGIPFSLVFLLSLGDLWSFLLSCWNILWEVECFFSFLQGVVDGVFLGVDTYALARRIANEFPLAYSHLKHHFPFFRTWDIHYGRKYEPRRLFPEHVAFCWCML